MTAAGRLVDARILLDCRWVGRGGVGRATELLLRGLGSIDPAGSWILWGPETVAPYLFGGAQHVVETASPKRRFGQHLSLPAHDVAIFMHQIRPLHVRRALTFVHDTIPLRHGGRPFVRAYKRAYLRAVVARADHVATVSEYSRRAIMHDLGVAPGRVTAVEYPLDRELVARVSALREVVAPRQTILYVGSFSPHKNLPRLIEAFARTDFARDGGELLLVGGAPAERERLSAVAAAHPLARVVIEGVCDDERLERLYASVRGVVMPSLEEGFGLPAWEAVTTGTRVAVSAAGPLPEITRGRAVVFPPLDVVAMTHALDELVAAPPPEPLVEAPQIEDFAAQVLDLLPLPSGSTIRSG